MKRNIKLYPLIVCIFVWQNTIFPLTPFTNSSKATATKDVSVPRKMMIQKKTLEGIKFTIMPRIFTLYPSLILSKVIVKCIKIFLLYILIAKAIGQPDGSPIVLPTASIYNVYNSATKGSQTARPNSDGNQSNAHRHYTEVHVFRKCQLILNGFFVRNSQFIDLLDLNKTN